MKRIFTLVFMIVICHWLSMAQQNVELTGKISFNVSAGLGEVRIAEITIGDGGTGPYKSVMSSDTTLPTHTIYRPADLSRFGSNEKLPIVVWGNGACKNGNSETRNLLSEIASHGFVVIAVGPLKYSIFDVEPSNRSMSDPKSLTDAIDWAIAQNSVKSSPLYGKVDVNKVAVMGQSCGGLMAMSLANDPRVTTIVMWNSGLFTTPPAGATQNPPQANPAPGNQNAPAAPNPPQANPAPGNQNAAAAPRMSMPSVPKSELKKLHCSIAYLTGGKNDIADANAADDYAQVEKVPAILARYDFSEIVAATGNEGVGHYPATYREPYGGDFGVAGVAWLKWQLKGDAEAAKMFTGPNPGLLKNKHWTLSKKNID